MSDPAAADPAAMPPNVAAVVQVNASVIVPAGATAPTSVFWHASIGVRARPATRLSGIAAASERTMISGVSRIAARSSSTQ
jgi:hypothetical protein